MIRLLNTGTFDRTSILFDPWTPLYGIYGILILLLWKRLLKKPVLVFLLNMILYSILEYMTNLGAELLTGQRLRDYSEFVLNLNGRIYLGGSIAFALIGCAFLYYLAPKWTDRYMKLGHSRRISLCILLYLLFIADIVLSIVIS